MLKKLTNVHSAYNVNKWKKDFNKHKELSEMISKTSGNNNLIVARETRKKYLLTNVQTEGLDNETAVLIKNILDRRNARIGTSKPQTANLLLPNIRDDFNRPSTSPYGNLENNPVEEHFPPPKEILEAAYPII